MSESWSDAVGACPRVKDSHGREWHFTLDTPAVVAEIEQLCLQWVREKFRQKVASLADRNVPGSIDQEIYKAEYAKLDRGITSEWYRTGGEWYRQWVGWRRPVGKDDAGNTLYEVVYEGTNEGKASAVLASMRIKHPEATIEDAIGLWMDRMDEVQPIFDRLGKVLADHLAKAVQAIRARSPEAAKKVEERVDEIVLSSSSPG